jgi:hypothetical protein
MKRGLIMAKVTVYYFETFKIKTGDMVTSKRMATLKYIKQIGGSSRAIMSTAKIVDSFEVDENGRYPKTLD